MAATSVAQALTVDEYLRSSYRPDCDYVDGHLEERNLGQYDHSRLQTLLAIWFGAHEREWGIKTLVEQRVQVVPTRFRIPDICLLRREGPIEQIVRSAPLMCVEILSPEDTLHGMRERVADYHRMGVEHIWIIDPSSREALVCTPSGWNQQADMNLEVAGTPIHVPLAKIFSDLDN